MTARALPFVEAGIEAGEAVLLALPEPKRELTRRALEIEEAQRHERLLDLAFGNLHGLAILCPADSPADDGSGSLAAGICRSSR